MGKIFVIIMFVMMTACSEEEQLQGDAMIQEVELSSFEEQYTEIIGNRPFLYDVKIQNGDVSAIYLTTDYYKNGQKIGTISELHSPIYKEVEDSYRIVSIRQPMNDLEEKWTIAIMTKDGYTSIDGIHHTEGLEKMSSYASGSISMPSPLMIGEKKVIATVVHSSKEGISIYNEISTEEQLKRATNYEHVYIISIGLK